MYIREFYELYHDLTPKFDAVRKILRKKYGEPIGEGRNREVYGNKHIVIKFPKNDAGVHDNSSEIIQFKRHKRDPLARCKIIYIDEIPLLVMELIDINVDFKELPDWATWYDMAQVGKNKKGEFKAYDYA